MKTPFNTALYQNIHILFCDKRMLGSRWCQESPEEPRSDRSSALSLHLTPASDNDRVGLLSHSLQQLPVSRSLGTSH